jgi:enamine deaminase RidA (YjgF/YER057c/UK114 family)
MSARVTMIDVPGWPRPRGYNNGAVGSGRVLHVAGQIGWNAQQQFDALDLVGQFGIALDNVLAVVRAAGGDAGDIAELTVFVTDMNAYRIGAAQLGAVYKERMGKHYPAMALVGVTELVEPRARVEIQAVAYLPEAP